MRDLRFYRPNKTESKGVSYSFQVGLKPNDDYKTPVIWFSAAAQNGQFDPANDVRPRFDWENKVSMMMNHFEAGQIVHAYNHPDQIDPEKGLKFEHTTSQGYKSLTIKPPTGDYTNWSISFYAKFGDDNKKNFFGTVSPGDICHLAEFCRGFVAHFHFSEKSEEFENAVS